MKIYVEFIKGLWKQNPVFRLALGLCPTLAVTTSVENGVGMGVASTFVLVCANFVVSLVRGVIPAKVRIPCFIVIIATFVTVVDLFMHAFAPALHKSLGLFIPLIVVNCIILGRAEAFASKNSPLLAVSDGLGMGLGFTAALVLLSSVREIIGSGTLLGFSPVRWDDPVLLFALAPGGFIALGVLLGAMNHVQKILARRTGRVFEPPATFDCRHCVICKWGDITPYAPEKEK